MAAVTKTLYDTDFALWAETTAKLVREGRLNEVDLENLAEEIEDLGKGERRAVRSQLGRMLMHLIQQKIQPERDGASWHESIVDSSRKLLNRLVDSPSLRRHLAEKLQEIYVSAVEDAERETRLSANMPQKCPYTLEELLK